MAGKSDGAVINPMIKTELGICAIIFAFLTAAAFLWFSGYEGRKKRFGLIFADMGGRRDGSKDTCRG